MVGHAGPADSPAPDEDPVTGLAGMGPYAEVARKLKIAHARVRALDVPDATRAALVRGLLIVTETAKRDLAEAGRRLDRFVVDLDAARPAPPAGR